jgi:NAD(P)-dependent dehydrogenase (short-subunit alcohol dehydrogenase family)
MAPEERPMEDLSRKVAVITGGGTGIGRELARQLAAAGCNVAICDLSAESMAETKRLCGAGTRISTHVADVSDEAQVTGFAREVRRAHDTDRVHLLFNNAGIGGGGSFLGADRREWDRTFGVCWFGVYYCTRAFMPMILKASEAHIVNTSSINGFWASLGPTRPHTAYSAAKFAVKGFTEALVNDLRLNAPHVKCSVVMPGHIGTSILRNSRKILTGKSLEEMGKAEFEQARRAIAATGVDASSLGDDRVRAILAEGVRRFEQEAPTSAAEAATAILDGVRKGQWRILVGADAYGLDAMARETPEEAYEPAFAQRLRDRGLWKFP